MSERIVREPERRSLTGVGRTKWWEMEREGECPKRVEIAPPVGFVNRQGVVHSRSHG